MFFPFLSKFPYGSFKHVTKTSLLKTIKAKRDAVYYDYLSSVIPFHDLEKIRNAYFFPYSWIIELTDLYDNLQCLTLVTKDSFPIYKLTMQLGLHFRLPPFAALFLKEYDLILSKFIPMLGKLDGLSCHVLFKWQCSVSPVLVFLSTYQVQQMH